MAAKSKGNLRFIIILGIGLFLAGYVVGSFLPAPVFGEEGFLGATIRRVGGNAHRR